MKLLMFAASLRQDSLNKNLIKIVDQLAKDQGISTDLADFNEFSAPLYNADDQNSTGFPAGIKDFIQRLQQADGLVISSPEYNFSIPGSLKNLIDWVSRITPMPWVGQPILLLSASPSLVGGNRGLWATRVPLEACGGFVYPDMFSLASAHTAFNESGELKDSGLRDRLKQNLTAFVAYASMLKNIKKVKGL